MGALRGPGARSRRPGRHPGLDVLELACGTAYFSAWLAGPVPPGGGGPLRRAAGHGAAGCRARLGPVFPLVQGDAERVPLASGRFDLVVSEHGAAAWCDPERWLPEAARLLRRGTLVFLTNSHLSALCVPAEEGVAEERLVRGQREAYRVRWPGGGIEFHPSHGDWVRLLRGSGFVVEAMHEIFAPPGAATTVLRDRVEATGRPGGRPRSSGWPCVRDDPCLCLRASRRSRTVAGSVALCTPEPDFRFVLVQRHVRRAGRHRNRIPGHARNPWGRSPGRGRVRVARPRPRARPSRVARSS